MKLIDAIARFLLRFSKKSSSPRPDVAALLNDELKDEIAQIAIKLKSERVSVRGLHVGEVPSETPEIEEKPF